MTQVELQRVLREIKLTPAKYENLSPRNKVIVAAELFREQGCDKQTTGTGSG